MPRLPLLAALFLATTAFLAPAQAQPSTENAVWLGHGFVAGTKGVQDFSRVASYLRDRKVRYLFINIGILGKDGKFTRGEAGFHTVKPFLAAADTWEKANGYQFKILAWLNGATDEASERYIDLSKPEIRAAMLDESKKISDPSADGSYISGTPRAFDGVQFDLEPSGADDVRFANIQKFMDELKAGLGKTKLTSFTAHKLGTKGRYWWSPSFYHYMARRVDILCNMSYDSGIKSEAEYRTWMAAQTVDTLNAVSGTFWKNDANHPAPKNGVKVFIGFPAFPTNNYHDVTAETMTAAALGTKDGLKTLTDANSPSRSYFGGGAVYLYTDGTGKDNYSNEATDWKAYEDTWLKP